MKITNNAVYYETTLSNLSTLPESSRLELCPECLEGQVIPEGRCKHCILCGWSACTL